MSGGRGGREGIVCVFCFFLQDGKYNMKEQTILLIFLDHAFNSLVSCNTFLNRDYVTVTKTTSHFECDNDD